VLDLGKLGGGIGHEGSLRCSRDVVAAYLVWIQTSNLGIHITAAPIGADRL
jgi:hypothetical protein